MERIYYDEDDAEWGRATELALSPEGPPDGVMFVEPHHPAFGVPDHCATCDTSARPHGVTYVVVGHGEFCSRPCYERWENG